MDGIRTKKHQEHENMPFKRRFRNKYASKSPERICCPNSVRLVLQVLGGFDEILMDERTYGRKNGRSETLTYGRTDGQIDRWKDGRDPLIELRGRI